MHAFIVCGSSHEKRMLQITGDLDRRTIALSDTVILEPNGPSIGIGDIRMFESRISFKPLSSPYTAGIIKHAHLLTIEAQHALLKTLEEPTAHTLIIIETPTSDVLIPTILSRCMVMKLMDDLVNSSEDASLDQLLKLTASLLGQRLKLGENIGKNRDASLEWLESMTRVCRQQLLNLHPTNTPSYEFQGKQLSLMIRRLQTARLQLIANVSPRLAIDLWLLSLPTEFSSTL